MVGFWFIFASSSFFLPKLAAYLYVCCIISRPRHILIKKLFSPSRGSTCAFFRSGSEQLILILSGVAGLLTLKTLLSPHSFLAAFNASRIAKKTVDPMKRGGSPTPRLRWMVRKFFHSTSLSSDTLKICGISLKPGILYAPNRNVRPALVQSKEKANTYPVHA